jgi:hypothetical protein
MSRILFAWELGGGYGHLGPFRPVAEALLARGHELTIAAREVQTAAAVFRSMPVRIVQAPICIKTYHGLAEPPLNFAEILMRYGYLDAPQLAGLLQAWRGLLDVTQADILIVDHAPTALLAARTRSISRAAIGTAFAVPLPVSPTPNMRAWVNVPEHRLASSDASVLETINASLPEGSPALRAVHEIFDGVVNLFTGVPELDPHGLRQSRDYLGLYSGGFGSVPPQWPEGEGPRIFVYLADEYRHIEPALAALAGSGGRCLGFLRTEKPDLLQKHRGPRFLLDNRPLNLDAAVAGSDLCVCHGNVGTVMSILRAGKPMLLLPIQLEHFLLSFKLKTLGIAEVVHPDEQPLDIPSALARTLREASLSEAARAFALKHREPPVATIIERAASRIETLAQT